MTGARGPSDHGSPRPIGLSRRQFGTLALSGATLAWLGSSPGSAVASTVRTGVAPAPDLVVTSPLLSADSAAAAALRAATDRTSGVVVESHAPQWDVAVVASQDPVPPGLVDLTGTTGGETSPAGTDSPVGQAQVDTDPSRVTIAAAAPAVYVRTDVIDDLGFAAPSTLEDLVALVLGTASMTRWERGLAVAADSPAWTQLLAGFATNLGAYNQASQLSEQLWHGCDVLGTLLRDSGSLDVAGFTREDAVAAFCGGGTAVLLDDAAFEPEIAMRASSEGVALRRFPLPMGPAGPGAGLAVPGLDVVVSQSSGDVPGAVDAATSIVAAAATSDQASAARSGARALSTAQAGALAEAVHVSGAARSERVREIAEVLSR